MVDSVLLSNNSHYATWVDLSHILYYGQYNPVCVLQSCKGSSTSKQNTIRKSNEDIYWMVVQYFWQGNTKRSPWSLGNLISDSVCVWATIMTPNLNIFGNTAPVFMLGLCVNVQAHLRTSGSGWFTHIFHASTLLDSFVSVSSSSVGGRGSSLGVWKKRPEPAPLGLMLGDIFSAWFS